MLSYSFSTRPEGGRHKNVHLHLLKTNSGRLVRLFFRLFGYFSPVCIIYYLLIYYYLLTYQLIYYTITQSVICYQLTRKVLRHPYSLIVDQRCVSHPRAKSHLHLGDISGVDQGLDETLWKGDGTTDSRGLTTALLRECSCT